MHRFFHWLPRVLAPGFALFLALFALDVFGAFDTLAETIIALVMHLIPTFLVLGVAAIAWRWPLVGGVIYLLLGGVSIMAFDTYEGLATFLSVSAPVFVIGLLFIWDALGDNLLARLRHT